MGLQWLRFELGMELTAEVPRVIRNFTDLDVHAVGCLSTDLQATCCQHVFELTIELIAMPVTFTDLCGFVRRAREAAFRQLARICAQAHRPAEFIHSL